MSDVVVLDDNDKMETDGSTTTTTKQNEDKYWSTLVESIYASDVYSISNETLLSLLNTVLERKEEIFRINVDYESFYTSLISFLTLKLVEHLHSFSLDQVKELEAASELLVNYYISYARKRYSEEFEASLSAHQVLALVECLLTAAPLDEDDITIDLSTLVAIMSSSKVPKWAPKVEEQVEAAVITDEKTESSKTMRNLVDSFVRMRFRENRLVDLSKDKKTVVELSNNNDLSLTPQELFKRYTQRYFMANGGIKAFLNECESNLTYLNVYRKNHLKQILTLAAQSPAAISYEEALQAKANAPDLTSDLIYLERFLNLPIFKESVTGAHLDLASLEQLTNLVLASQIASLTTLAAELTIESSNSQLKRQTSSQQQQPAEENTTTTTATNPSNPSPLLVRLIKLSMSILDKYVNILEMGAKPNKRRNFNTLCTYVILHYADLLVRLQQDQLDKQPTTETVKEDQTTFKLFASIELNTALNNYTNRLISMAGYMSGEDEEEAKPSRDLDLNVRDFDKAKYYSALELFAVVNNSFKAANKQSSLFTILLASFRVRFSSTVYYSELLRTRCDKDSILSSSWPATKSGGDEELVIRNIDDVSSEEDNLRDEDEEEEEKTSTTTATAVARKEAKKKLPSKDQEQQEDGDDMLLGPWFDQLNSADALTTAPVAKVEAKASNVAASKPTQQQADFNATSLKAIIESNLSLMQILLEFIEDLCLVDEKIELIVAELIACFSKEEISRVANIIEHVQTKLDNKIYDNFINSFYGFLQFLLVKNILNYEKQDSLLFEYLNLDEKLIPTANQRETIRIYHSLICQSFTLRLLGRDELVESTRAKIIKLWSQLLDALIKPQQSPESAQKCDLDLDTASLFLYFFHNLDIDRQKAVLVEVARTIISSQANATFPPLVYSRLVFLFDYLVRHFEEASPKLLDQIDRQLLATSTPNQSKSSATDWVQVLYQNMERKDKAIPNLFYTLYHASEKRVSQVAVKTLSDDKAFKTADYERLYSALTRSMEAYKEVELSSESGFGCHDYASLSYLFGLVWSLLTPDVLPVSKKFVHDVTQSLFELDAASKITSAKRGALNLSAFELLHWLRLVYHENELVKHVGEFVLQSASSEALFFIRLWAERSIVLPDMVVLNYQLAHLENTLRRDPLNDSQSLLECLLKQIVHLKTSYKKKYIKTSTPIQELALNISLVNRTINNDSSGTTTSQFGDSTSLLLDLFECSDLECFAELKSRMKKLNDEVKANSALTAHVDRRECFIDATNRWLAPANAYQHSILNLCRLVAEIINVATANLSNEILEEVVMVFIDLNADANSFPFLAEVISRIFNSAQIQKHAIASLKLESTEMEKFKLENFLYPRIAQFTVKTVYEICTRFFYSVPTDLTTNSPYDAFFIHLLAFVDKMLDSAHGLQGFCHFFADSPTVQPISAAQLEQLTSTTLPILFADLDAFSSKFLVLLLTTYRCSSRQYFIQMLTVVNKLLRISYQINRSNSKNKTHELSSNSSSLISSVTSNVGVQNVAFTSCSEKLVSILNQINRISILPIETVITWLSKLIDSFEASQGSVNAEQSPIAIKYRYTLRQLVIYLSQENGADSSSSLTSEVCMSLLKALIKLASPLLVSSDEKKDSAAAVFPELLILMDVLGSNDSGHGYLTLFEACCGWLESLSGSRKLVDSSSSSLDDDSALVKSASYILSYVCEILNVALKTSPGAGAKQAAAIDLACVEPSVTDEVNKIVQKKLKIDFYQDTFKLLDQVKANFLDSGDESTTTGQRGAGDKKKISSTSTWARSSQKRARKSSIVNKKTAATSSTGAAASSGLKTSDQNNPFGEETAGEEENEPLTEEAVTGAAPIPAAPIAASVADNNNNNNQMRQNNEDEDDEENYYDDLNVDDTYNDQDDEEDVDNEDLDGAGKVGGGGAAGSSGAANRRGENQDTGVGHNDDDDDNDGDDDDHNGYYDFEEKSSYNVRMLRSRLSNANAAASGANQNASSTTNPTATAASTSAATGGNNQQPQGATAASTSSGGATGSGNKNHLFDIKYYDEEGDEDEDEEMEEDDQEEEEDDDDDHDPDEDQDDEDMDAYEEDEERLLAPKKATTATLPVESVSATSTSSQAVAVPTTTTTAGSAAASQASTVAASLNRIDINDLFSLGFVEELAAAAAAASSSGAGRHRGRGNLLTAGAGGEPDDDGDDDEEPDEDEDDDEYGDDFNDNFADYENIRDSIPASQSLSRPNLANLVSVGRDAIYQEIMTTLSEALTAGRGAGSSGGSGAAAAAAAAAAAISAGTQAAAAQQQQQQQATKTSGQTTTVDNNPPSKSTIVGAKSGKPGVDDDEDLDNKLCTFTVTKKDFMNQHWYYCHTCRMIDRIGMCTVCAKVCHKGHDVSYAKYGSFFCDCGAKEDGSCKALTKRTSLHAAAATSAADSKPKSAISIGNGGAKPSKSGTSLLDKPKRNKLASSSSTTTIKFTDSNLKLAENADGYRQQANVDVLRRLVVQIRGNKPKQLERLRAEIVEMAKNKNLTRIMRTLIDETLMPAAKRLYDNSLLSTNSLLSRYYLGKLKSQNFEIPDYVRLATIRNESEKAKEATEQTTSTAVLNKAPPIEPQSLFIVTLGSQEGAFENVRMTYAGDQGQTIKQLIQTHALRRVSMCCLATKTRKHLIVTHEKGKSSHFTILELNALLKQDSNKRNKLTLTKLNTVPVPFTLISVVANACNESYIALVGLKDLYVMYLSETGLTKQDMATAAAAAAATTATTATANTSNQQQSTTSDSSAGLIVVHPSIEASNYIIKAVWLPGSQTEIALVTADFVKIYDLSVDKISPIYYFLLPMGKIKDVTFVYDTSRRNDEASSGNGKDALSNEIGVNKQEKYIVIMTSCGYLYYEMLCELSSAKNGVYYVTSTIEFNPNEGLNVVVSPPPPPPTQTPSQSTSNDKDKSGHLLGGGVSVYYSFKLQMLFWSYLQGKTFIGAFKSNSLVLDKVWPLSSSNTPQQPLCNWSEIASHPGLVMSMTLLSNNPVILMLLPDKIIYQEIKLVNNQGAPSKAKIQDMVAIRHPSGGPSGDEADEASSTVPGASSSTETDSNADSDDSANTNEKTTMILLCDDGSLKIYVADQEKTEFWLQPHLRPVNGIIQQQIPQLPANSSGVKSASFSSANAAWLSSGLLWNLLPSTILDNSKAVAIKNTTSDVQSDSKSSIKTSGTATATNGTLKRSNAIRSKTPSQQQPASKRPASSKQPSQSLPATLVFPIDYFEKCTQLLDVEYSGSPDLIEVYNSQQLKLRLTVNNSSTVGAASANRFVVSSRPTGYRLDITNAHTDAANRLLLMGCRLLVGTTSLDRVPQYVEVLGRRVHIGKVSRPRWVDVCLTRDEAFICDNKLSMTIGPSQQAEDKTSGGLTVLDGVMCYARSKSDLGYSKNEVATLQKKYQQEKQQAEAVALNQLSKASAANKQDDKGSDGKDKKSNSAQVSTSNMSLIGGGAQLELAFANEPKPFDRLMAQSLDLYESCLNLASESSSEQSSAMVEASSRTISCDLLSLISAPLVSHKAKSLLWSSLQAQQQPSPTTALSLYNAYKDDALVNLLSVSFRPIRFGHLYDLENLQKCLLVCKSLIQQQRAHNLVKYLNDKFNSTDSFLVNLNALFWRVANRHCLPAQSLSCIGDPNLANLSSIIETLIETMHAFLLVDSTNNRVIVDSYLRLLCSDSLDVNFCARKTLLALLKQPKKSASTVATTTTVPAATPTPAPSKSAPKPAAKTSVTGSSTATGGEVASTAAAAAIGGDRVDDALRFPTLNTANIQPADMQVAEGDEIIDYSEGQFLEENPNATAAAAAPSEPAIAANVAAALAAVIGNNPANPANLGELLNIAPYEINEDDEMLQIAMALSLNEHQQQQQQQQQQTPAVIPPPTLPRTIPTNPISGDNTTTTATPTTSNNLDVSKSVKATKRKTTPTDESKSQDSKSTMTVNLWTNAPPPPYLLNLSTKLYQLRKLLLDKFVERIESPTFAYYLAANGSSQVTDSGLKSIAYFQCLLALMSDLNGRDESDKVVLDRLIRGLLNTLEPLKNPAALEADGQKPIYVRTCENEIRLMSLRTISILLSKSKYQRSGDNCNFIIQTLLSHLCQFDIIEVCLNLMKHIYCDHWKKLKLASDSSDEVLTQGSPLSSSTDSSQSLMKFTSEFKYYEELAPYFVRDPLNKDSFVVPAPNLQLTSDPPPAAATTTTAATNPPTAATATTAAKPATPQPSVTAANRNLFDNYTELLSEIVIRLPYQMKKLCLGNSGSSSSTSTNLISDPQLQQYQTNLNLIGTMFDFAAWTHYLCEYLLVPQCHYLKRLIKKLLQILCGSKDKYRRFKDQHILTTSMKQLSTLCPLSSHPNPISMLSLGSTLNTAIETISYINLPVVLSQNSGSKSTNTNLTTSKLSYTSLLKILDNLKLILEIAASRAANWQRFCLQNPSAIQYLIELALLMGVDSNGSGSDSSNLSGSSSISVALTPVIVPTLLQCIVYSLGTSSSSKTAPIAQPQQQSGAAKPGVLSTSSSLQAQKGKSGSNGGTQQRLALTDDSSSLAALISSHIFKQLPRETMLRFTRTYLLEAFSSQVRWTMHSLLYSLHKTMTTPDLYIYDLLLHLWPDAALSPKSAQYIDLIGYAALKAPSTPSQSWPCGKELLQKSIDVFQYAGSVLATHPNTSLYTSLSSIIGSNGLDGAPAAATTISSGAPQSATTPVFDGFYLEAEPCFACNNIEAPLLNLKLNSIKADSRFTTSQQIYKLIGSYAISKIIIKISDIRKNKMISLLNVYYTSRLNQSIVDLKMNPRLWSKAKKVHIQPSQNEIKIEFALPIIACNLMLEYADFYDRDSANSTEASTTTMLQCPRCSTSVPANPGVCSACGENVFQCHKCRAINYDERDPFLCNSCGFCKFAKFEITLVARQFCSVDPIESEEDRKSTLATIGSLLDRADKIYTSMSQQLKPTLEAMLVRLNEQHCLDRYVVPSQPPVNAANTLVAQPTIVTVDQAAGMRLTPLTVISSNGTSQLAITTTAKPPANMAINNMVVGSNLLLSKTVQSVVQKYTIECKAKFDELSKIILKLNLCRKELREYDKQFKSNGHSANGNGGNLTSMCASEAVSRKNSTAAGASATEVKQLTRLQSHLSTLAKLQQTKSTCFGCAAAAIEHCLTLFRVFLCSAHMQQQPQLLQHVRSELCRHNILEELVNFGLKRNYNLMSGPTILPTPTPPATTNVPTAAQSGGNNQTAAQQAANAAAAAAAQAAAVSNANALNQSIMQQKLYDRDIINLIYYLIKDNPEGCERFNRLLIDKVEAFLAPLVSSTTTSTTTATDLTPVLCNVTQTSLSPIRSEMVLLGALMQKQFDDSCWEQRLRLVIHILMRSLSVSNIIDQNLAQQNRPQRHQQHYSNPVVIECLTLPCLRILNHLCKSSTNVAHLTHLITSARSQKATAASTSSIPVPTSISRQNTTQQPSSQQLGRFYSEPSEANYLQMQSQLFQNTIASNIPTSNDINMLDFLAFNKSSSNTESYFEQWSKIVRLGVANQAQQKSSSSSASTTEDQQSTVQMKAKYFAAWRKYTLKKRKQQQQSGTTKPASLTHQSSTDKPSFISLTEQFNYDLKSKWLKYCLFCPSSRSVRQLTCNLVQNLFSFYASTGSSQIVSSSPAVASNNNGDIENLNGNELFIHSQHYQQQNWRKFELAETLVTEFIEECRTSGECFVEYLGLIKSVILGDKDCKYRLVFGKCDILNRIESLLHKEIRYLSDLERLSESLPSANPFGVFASAMSASQGQSTPTISLNAHSSVLFTTSMTLGYSIRSLTDLLSLLLKEPLIRNKFKSRLIATVLNSYLSLKKLLFQRTKLIDEAQDRLLATLEQMTTGTEVETRKFMHICIDTVNNFDLDDLVTPVFIFERLCNIIYPEEVVDAKEFLLILEKDPNQEDYLQGRMLGNPYSSNEVGLGPLMRNIKNKICTDCELIALLEDDNGMELLVNNKIISLDLPVRDVYKKVWLSEVLSEHEPMRIVYRMTGLSGDATEDIIDSLDQKGQENTKNDEDVYRMADELSYSNGAAMEVMLERLAAINQQNFTFGKPLLAVLLKLFDYALKLAVNRALIIRPEMKAITTMLQTLNMMLKIEQAEPNKIGVDLAEKLINIMEVILSEASKQPAHVYNEFAALCGDTEQLEFLMSNIKSRFVRSHTTLMQSLMRLIPFLSFGDEAKMRSLIAYFITYMRSLDEFDEKIALTQTNTANTNEDLLHLECFSVIVNGIESGEMGARLRDMMRDAGVVKLCIDYLVSHSPQITTYLNSDYELWKEMLARNSLPYVIRILTGLCRSHESIQDLIGETCLPILHKLEQFSSQNLVGVLAEDLLVALKQNVSSKVAAAIEEIREKTKNEKKKLAMAMRKKQLTQLGMKTNDKGQLIKVEQSSTLKTLTDEVEEEKGHVCCICREGYKYHPQKVLAIYTYTKKVDLEPLYEAKPRKTIGYSTVTHFNLVHIDCHTNAIRSARSGRDEWENAALQNANTKCNGMLPIWGPEVTETIFSNALARHNNYLLEATGIRDASYLLSVHDLKLLIARFAENLSFSEDAGGGGRESNIYLIPYMMHSILYSINTAKYVAREERNMNNFLDATEKLISNSFECDNVFYYITMALIIMKPNDWQTNKYKFLRRILLTVHTRLVNSPALDKQKLTSTNILEFKKYKPGLLFIGLINLFYSNLHGRVEYPKVEGSGEIWTEALANYIRHNDIGLMDSCKTVLRQFEEELMVCEDWIEMFDVLGFLSEINDPVEFLKTHLNSFK